MTSAPRDRPRAPPAAIALLAVALFAYWALDEGGAAPGAWYPGALLVLAALLVTARSQEWRRMPPHGRRALSLLAAFTAWSFLSIAWADARGDAWDGANRTLLYLTVFALFATMPWRRADAAMFLTGFALAMAASGIWVLVEAVAADDPTAFVGGRMAGPVGYENASAALFAAALWPPVLLATREHTTWASRGALLAVAVVLAELCVLTQSRGSLIAALVAGTAALVLTRRRGRLLLALGAVAVPTLAALPVLLAVFDRAADGGDGVLVRAGVAIALSAFAVGAAGFWLGRRTRRRPLGPAFAGGARWLAPVAGVLAIAGAGLALARPETVPGAGGAVHAVDSRFTAGFESGRYDMWRVAARQLARHPLHGAGADNFAHDYVRERRRREEPLYPHSIFLRTFGQTGLMGGALFVGFLVMAGGAALRSRNEPVIVAAAVSAVAWLAHASIDWLWELPGLAAPAMACLGLVAGASFAGAPASPPAPPRRGRLAAAVAVAGAAGATASYALPALAAREIERGARTASYDALERARDLNPLTDRADVIGGVLAAAAGDRRRARLWFERALDRDPHNWYPHVRLALIDASEGGRAAALHRLDHARRLNPLEPAIAAAASAARAGGAAPAEVERRLDGLAVPGPLGRRPLTCRPVLGLAADCTRGAGS